MKLKAEALIPKLDHNTFSCTRYRVRKMKDENF